MTLGAGSLGADNLGAGSLGASLTLCPPAGVAGLPWELLNTPQHPGRLLQGQGVRQAVDQGVLGGQSGGQSEVGQWSNSG